MEQSRFNNQDQNSNSLQMEEQVKPEIRYPPNVVQLDSSIPKQFISNQLEVGNEIKIHVADIRNPSQFWVNLKAGLLDVADLMYYIQEVYFDENQSKGLKISEEDATVGMFCVALYAGEYNRGVVKKVMVESRQVEILFFDYGTVALVDSDKLYFLLNKFSYLPQQAIKAKLAGIQPYEATWSVEATRIFSDMVGQFKELTAKIARIDRNNKILRLVLKDDENDESIGDALVRKKFAVDENTSLVSSERESQIELPYFSKPRRDFIVQQFVPIEATEQDEFRFCVGEIINPSKFWLITEDGFNDLALLLDKIYYTYTEQSETLKIQEEALKRGMLCIALYKEEYARGLIRQVIIEEHKAEVFFFDFGTVSFIDSRELLVLLEEFMDLPRQAIEARLVGICPVETDWSIEATQKFSSMVADYTIVTAKIVNIDWYKRILDVSLVDKSNGVCINTALVEDNLARDETDEPEHQSMKFENEIQNPPHGIKIDDDIPNQFGLTKFQERGEIVVHLTEILNPSQFWVILNDGYEDFKKLMMELHETYINESQKLKISENQLKEGMLCVALNGSKYNRASIERVRMEDRQVDVIFFDYGKNSSVDLAQLHFMYERFAHIPRQAIKAMLARIVPLEPETSWPSEATRSFSEMVKEKPLVGRISSLDRENQILKVLLVDNSADNSKCINDVLIQKEWASIDY